METVRAIMSSKFKSPKTKLSLKTSKYLASAFDCFIQEAVLRSGKQSISEGSKVVTCDIVHKVVVQLLLDFA